MNALSTLQDLLRELFQFDLADLDFGIYRLLRLKHAEIESFLTRQLPASVEQAFQSIGGAERASVEVKVRELAERIHNEIADDALLPSGEVKPEHRDQRAKAMRELIATYDAARQQLQSVKAADEQQAEVFNHLYNFFSRYYEAGDFMPRRRYGARETYAVPYNGEETLFHWTNKDQHYVKTAEAFRDYAFGVEVLGGLFRVRFVLTEAHLPPGNTKGDTRYFFPLPDEVTYDVAAKTFVLPFHYRLPSVAEVENLGKNSKLQEAVLLKALSPILQKVPDAALRAALAETEQSARPLRSDVTQPDAGRNGGALETSETGETPALLLKRLRHFCRRNTTDYFIHKDLAGFLQRELEFFLKDQVLHLGDLEGNLEAKGRTLRVVRQVAGDLIQFLAQIENVQKRLFEKRKFVLRTDYLVPIKEMPRDLWAEVIANKAQITAWKRLFAIDPKPNLFNKSGKVNDQFLVDHPTLVVDTSHFDRAFREKLLTSFDDLDGVTDGLLIQAENYQALRFLERKFAGKVKCIYIDPPYNTGSDEFIYKDRYQHSCWLSMMVQRLACSRELMSGDGAIFVSIDDHEIYELQLLMQTVFHEPNFLSNFVRRRRMTTGMRNEPISPDHEYLVSYARSKGELTLFGKKQDVAGYPLEDERSRYASTDLTVGMTRQMRPKQFYAIRNPETKVEYWSPENRVWRFDPETMADHIVAKNIIWPGEGSNMSRPRFKTRFDPANLQMRPISTWIDTEPSEESESESLTGGLNQEGTKELRNLFGAQLVQYPKPVSFIRSVVSAASANGHYLLDFFAGSGTTGHAVVNLNREDGAQRKFILVEMGLQFDSVMCARLQKVIYTPAWKDGRPTRLPTKDEVEYTPRVIKVLRLEGYEDALHNLSTAETLKAEAARATAHRHVTGEEAYRLSYLVQLAMESSASLLSLEKLEHPFDYSIEVLTESGPQAHTVDLIETFNFLYGLHVKKWQRWLNEKDKRIYRVVKGVKENQRVLVLWRDMAGLDPSLEREFLEAQLKRAGEFEEKWINGDSGTPGIASLDAIFKRLIEEEDR